MSARQSPSSPNPQAGSLVGAAVPTARVRAKAPVFKVAMVQQAMDEDRQGNLAQSVEAIRQAASRGARLVVLSELHRSRYFCQTENPAVFDEAESIPGPTTQVLCRVAADTGVVIVGSVFEKRAPGLYHNTAVVIDADGKIAGIYRKMHIPDDPGYYEKFYFAPGDMGFKPIDTQVCRLGVLVCWDQWYPEAARLMALAGAELLVYPTAIGFDPRDPAELRERQRQAWITIQRGHAIANGVHVAVANRVGFEPDPSAATSGIQFWGSSFLCGPQGEVLAEGGPDDALVLMTEVDLERAEAVRRIWPFFRDRRVDAYNDLTRRWRDGTGD